MEMLWWALTGIVAVIVLAIYIALRVYMGAGNRLIALDQRCDTAFADIDVHLKHRHNLIPGLVEVTKGVAKHERDIILSITDARANALGVVAPAMRLEAEGNLTAQISTLLSAVEKYPDLRALPEFTQLRQQLVDCENRITAARRFYNLAIEEYNTVMRQFPGSLVAHRRSLSGRQAYDLGAERVRVDKPVAIAL